MTDPDPTAERAKVMDGSVNSRVHVSTSPNKIGVVPPPSGSHSGIYRTSWSLTPKDLVSDHDTALEWCLYAFPPATTEALTFLADEHMADGLHYAAAQVYYYLASAAERISDIEAIESYSNKMNI